MSERKRLLLVSTELRPAGAERVVFELATRLPAHGFDVAVASLKSPGGDDGLVAERLRERDITVHALRMKHKLDLGAVVRFRGVLREFRPDVVNAHQFHAYFLARLFAGRVGARVVSTLHVVDRRWLPLRRLADRLTARRDDATVCVSRAVADNARRRLGASSPVVVHNGIDLERFASPPPRDEARRALGLPVEARVVGAVARLDRQKGLDVLVDAFARAAQHDDGLHLLLCGDGPEREALARRAPGLRERMHVIGFREDVETAYAALDVFCMPSRWEGFGLALVEAMACGLPCLAAEVDSLPEVLGDAGATFPPGDVDVLARLIELALDAPPGTEDPRERARRFDVETMVEATARVLRGES